MGDTNVVNWAREFVMRRSEKDWLGYYVYAVSPIPAADIFARQVIERGSSDALVSLVQGYQDSKRRGRLDRIKDVIALKSKNRKLLFWLRGTLGDWAYDGNKEAAFLINQLPVVEAE